MGEWLYSENGLRNMSDELPSISQSAVPVLRKRALFCNLEIKKPYGHPDPVPQLGVWPVTGLTKLSNLARESRNKTGRGGELQFAKALLRAPKTLLLDEAASALDFDSERTIQLVFDCAAIGRTTIAVSHRLSTIQNADRIYIFDRGTIVEVGCHAELMNRKGIPGAGQVAAIWKWRR
ncbi:uncharacterized protein Z518_05477 [Rhinocladiella mackenziei CBS 650.93]|uniref:ABC transporter domain-containing protein n=1 Tax=Rhinocladiella mackenziei CBS 650.93 TaxID=1442369 RepID=A0A0D2FQZ1_9EURO|nr:uncharacterized protein Z518_05477 [Rhinocladiella mackenziei CBS 650.93]KIX04607.1 hypothetical protein Z518_05477 [Rhinocladiella mackenziei CBS 650.93]